MTRRNTGASAGKAAGTKTPLPKRSKAAARGASTSAGGAGTDHHRQARAWIVDHLSQKHGVRGSKVQMGQPVADWGLDKQRLADLATDFNAHAADQPLWRNCDVAPPDMIAAVGADGTLGDLASFLGDQGTSATAAKAGIPTEPQFEAFLQLLINQRHPFSEGHPELGFGTPDLTLDDKDIVAMARALNERFGLLKMDNLIKKYCVAPQTVSSAAAKIYADIHPVTNHV